MKRLRVMLKNIIDRCGRCHGWYMEPTYDDLMPILSETESYGNHYNVTAPFTNNDDENERSVEDIAREVAQMLWEAEDNDDALQINISELVGAHRWNRKMVEECLNNVIEYVGQGRTGMGDAMCQALDKATDVADNEFTFPRQHPQSVDGFIAIVSVGMLAELQGAWVLELLGFGDVQEKFKSSSFAACWAREYGAYIPSGSVCAYLRGLGGQSLRAELLRIPMSGNGSPNFSRPDMIVLGRPSYVKTVDREARGSSP